MNRYSIVFLITCFLILPVLHAQEQPGIDSQTAETEGLKITVTSMDINDKALKLSYEIRNDSKQEIWICDDIHMYNEIHSEIYLAEDDQTLVIRRRFDLEPVTKPKI